MCEAIKKPSEGVERVELKPRLSVLLRPVENRKFRGAHEKKVVLF